MLVYPHPGNGVSVKLDTERADIGHKNKLVEPVSNETNFVKRPKFTEQTILSVAKTTLANARNHLGALTEFGVSDEMLNQFEQDIRATEALPDESYNRIELRNSTQCKEKALHACYQWGRKLRVRLHLAFGRNSSQAKSFPSIQFRNAIHSESNMMPAMETLIALAERYQNELAEFGQTPVMIIKGQQLLEALRQAATEQELKKDTKRLATRIRYQNFQRLYDMVNRINRIARLVFENDSVHLSLFESKWPSRSKATVEEIV